MATVFRSEVTDSGISFRSVAVSSDIVVFLCCCSQERHFRNSDNPPELGIVGIRCTKWRLVVKCVHFLKFWNFMFAFQLLFFAFQLLFFGSFLQNPDKKGKSAQLLFLDFRAKTTSERAAGRMGPRPVWTRSGSKFNIRSWFSARSFSCPLIY